VEQEPKPRCDALACIFARRLERRFEIESVEHRARRVGSSPRRRVSLCSTGSTGATHATHAISRRRSPVGDAGCKRGRKVHEGVGDWEEIMWLLQRQASGTLASDVSVT